MKTVYNAGNVRIGIFGQCSGTLVVRRLSVPFAATIAVRSCKGWLTVRGWTRELDAGAWLDVPPLTRFDLSLAPGAIVELALQTGLERAAPKEATLNPALWPARPGRPGASAPQCDQGKALTRELARSVFLAPHHEWRCSTFGARFGMGGKAVSRGIFAEGESFRETVRLYRLSRLLFDLPALPKVDGDIAQSYGFGSRSLLEAAFYGMFDLPLVVAHAQVLASTEARKRMAAPNVNGSVDAPFNPVACEGYSWAVPRCFLAG
ncbi:hypothetical protein [Cupriavidus sp. USMAA2-4]|uniref:hypothetical protein n=1 Tax=Cupriavidus sp. USMAA2-4 TaxID=876364 RepID=UPI0012F4BF42|nr:hypothetical protein [Cupriavidus sp. USMAA2-4]